jgi:hypothetical protein
MRLRWLRRHGRADAPGEVLLPFATTRWVPEQLVTAAEPAVTLGFRDGSTVEVSPDSVEGQALRTAAAALVDRKADT